MGIYGLEDSVHLVPILIGKLNFFTINKSKNISHFSINQHNQLIQQMHGSLQQWRLIKEKYWGFPRSFVTTFVFGSVVWRNVFVNISRPLPFWSSNPFNLSLVFNTAFHLINDFVCAEGQVWAFFEIIGYFSILATDFFYIPVYIKKHIVGAVFPETVPVREQDTLDPYLIFAVGIKPVTFCSWIFRPTCC